MRVKVYPSSTSGTIAIPASKSMAHRALICASLAQGTSRIDQITYSKDIEATIACMEAFGASIEKKDTYCVVTGCNITNCDTPVTIDCNESGSTLRFLVPLAALTQTTITMEGHGRLLQRPMDIYHEIFDAQNITFKQEDVITVHGPLHSDTFKIRGDISSQFITGLLFALPLLKEDSHIEIIEPFESKSYVDLTIQMLHTFGIQIIQNDNTNYTIPGNQKYQAKDVSVEGDYSQLAFFAVLGAVQNSLTLTNMDPNSKQGDKAILDFIQKAGANVYYKNGFHIQSQSLNAQTMDIANCPDLGPILCILASFCKGETKLIHAQRLRMKESDRIEAMEEELKKWHVDISSTLDTITIHGKNTYNTVEEDIYGHNDHRIVMAMTVFGLCAQVPSIIDDAQAISKSYPTFFEDIQKIGGKVELL